MVTLRADTAMVVMVTAAVVVERRTRVGVFVDQVELVSFFVFVRFVPGAGFSVHICLHIEILKLPSFLFISFRSFLIGLFLHSVDFEI